MSDPADGLTTAEAAQLADLEVILIPAAGGMPSARDVPGASNWLDRALAVRSDLLPALRRAIAKAHGARSVETIASALSDDPTAMTALTLLVAGAYYMNPEVRTKLGYPGQEARPTDPLGTPTFLSDGLLERVLERGARYRPTPASS
jgi:hypothetical protein